VEFILNTIDAWGYPAIFVGGFIEGLNVTLVSSFFIAHGVFSPYGVFLASAFGNFLSDLMWYSLGKKYGIKTLERVSNVFLFFRILGKHKVIDKIQTYFKQKGGLVILISKFAIGPGIAAQIVAGSSGMPTKQFARISAFANAIFTATLIGIGYSFGEGYRAAASLVQNTGVLIFLVILAFVAIEIYGSSIFGALFPIKESSQNNSKKS